MPSGLKLMTPMVFGRRAMLGAALAVPLVHYSRSNMLRQTDERVADYVTVADMLADPRLTYGSVLPGKRVHASEFEYIVMPANASNHQLITVGGVKLQVTGSVIRPEQFGLEGIGDELDGMQAVLDFAGGRAPLLISRPHYIRPNTKRQRLSVRSNTRIRFELGGRIENLEHDLPGYEMFELRNVRNIEIIDAVLDGRRDLNRATTGEWGNGIQVLGEVDNIRIMNPTTRNMWGDGIYVGEEFGTGRNPVSIEIWNHRAENCRRQGMSITSARRCIVHDPVWTGTGGTLPSAGLDIEPNSSSCVLEDIRIFNPVTRDNTGPGILVFLDPLRRTSRPISILIENHRSTGDQHGAQFSRPGLSGSHVAGQITYRRALIENARFSGIMINDWDVRGASIAIEEPIVRNPNMADATPEYSKAGITIRNGSDGDADTIGNVSITGATITAVGTSHIRHFLFVQNEKKPNAVDKVSIVDPIALVGADSSWIEGRVRWEDNNRVSVQNHIDTTDSQLIGKWAFRGHYSNKGAHGTVKYKLSARETPIGWPDIVIEAQDYPIQVDPDGADKITNGGKSGSLEIPPRGRATLRRSSLHEWTIVASRGNLRLPAN